MKKVTIYASLILMACFVWSCGNKAEMDPVKGFESYKDDALKFEIKYPSNWHVAQKRTGDRLVVYSSNNGMSRFSFQGDYSTGHPVARIALIPVKLENGFNPDSVFEKFKLFDPSTYSTPEKVKIDGIDAIKRNYAFQLNDGNFEGEIYIAAKDTAYATVIYFESFGGTFKDYKKAAFDQVLASVKLAQSPQLRQDTITVVEEAPLPSQTFKSVQGEGYTIQIPDNFANERAKASRDAIYSTMYIGERRGDCYIAVVVKDASKQKDAKKIADETIKGIAGASPASQTSIAGEKAYMTTYTQATKEGTVKTRLYFTVKGDKLFQIALTYNTTKEQKEYLPVLEKMLGSIKF